MNMRPFVVPIVAAILMLSGCSKQEDIRITTPVGDNSTPTTGPVVAQLPDPAPITAQHAPSASPIEGIEAGRDIPASEAKWVEFLLEHVPVDMMASDLNRTMAGKYMDRGWVGLGGQGSVGLVYKVAPHFDVGFYLADGKQGKVTHVLLIRRDGVWKKDPTGWMDDYAWFY